VGVGTDAARFLRARLAVEDCHAPYLIDAELGNALRRQVQRHEIPPSTAEVVLVRRRD
jgi:predicted nucleic acid-binding protein